MTVQEMQQLFYLGGLIERERSRLADLEAAAGIHAQRYDGNPSAVPHDRLGELVPEITLQRERIQERIRQYSETQQRIQDYIDSIRSPRIKLIMLYRYVDMMTWQQVADSVGGRETEYTVKNAAYRYLERNETN